MVSDHNLIWIDLEMSGLDPRIHRILEIATIVTDAQLNILAEGESLVIHQQPDILDAMDNWCTTTHTASALVGHVQQSTLDEPTAEQQILAFLRQWVPAGCSPICGNSIGQDRRFLRRYMPQLEGYFHYRCIDVSTLKELAKRWRPQILDGLHKQSTHQALADIRDSIAELAYYRQHLLVC